MNLGWTEILLIGGIALLLFGPSKLPNLGRSLGQSIRGFKKGLTEDESAREVNEQLEQNTQKPMKEAQAHHENETHKKS